MFWHVFSLVLALIEIQLTDNKCNKSSEAFKMSLSIVLTSYIQLHGIALAVALAVAAHTRVDARPGAAGVLQHKALIGHDNALGRVVLQYVALQR